MARSVRLIFALGLVASVVLIAGCTDANLKKARRYQEDKNYDQAIRYYQMAIRKDPDNRSARYGLVETVSEQLAQTPQDALTAEMVEQAMVEVRSAAQPLMDDANVKRYVSIIHQLLARRYAEQGEDDKAAEAWAEVIKIDPTLAEGHYNLGMALAKQGKSGEAIRHFEKAVDMNPYFLEGYLSMGNALISEQRFDEAVKNYQKALEINPDAPEARHNLAVAYSHLDKKEEAIKELEKAIELQPGFFMAYRSLSKIYKGMEDTEQVAEIDKRWEEYAKAHAVPEQIEQPGAGGDSDLPLQTSGD